MDPYGRHVKIREENKKFIPKDWKKKTDGKFFKDGVLTEKAQGLVEITSRKHAKWFTSPYNINIGLMFGSLGDGKRKKNLF